MFWLRTLVAVCALSVVARAQTVLFSGSGAQSSPGGGTRSALLIGGQYVVFFNDGNSVVYVTTPDGVTFSAPQPASTTPANLGFSVARNGDRVGIVWAYNNANGYFLWFREAMISGASITLGPPTQVATHLTDTRGYLATLAYSAAGTPYIAALEYGQTYTGPIGPGCGSAARYRPTHYYRQTSTWTMRSYCNNFDTIRDPNSIAIAPSGQNMIVSSLIDANMSTQIVNDTAELGEPWHMVPAVDHLVPAQASTVQSVTTPSDVHMVYRDGAGMVSYGRQDGTLVDLNTTLSDVTVLDAAARNPALSQPATSAGCYVAVYTVGNSIRKRTFKGSIATLTPESTVFTTQAAPTNVSAELTAATAPAIVWQEGTKIMFGFATGGPATTLTATPTAAPADGSTLVTVSSTPFTDACGSPIAAGTPVTVTTSIGTIADSDASAQFDGTQVLADSSGRVAFQVRAGTTSGMAVIAAMPTSGGGNASVKVMFGSSSAPPGCGDGALDVNAGEQCDSGGVDTATCNAGNCQPPVCGDGYVNVAAGEQCEDGSLCDMTTCSYTFSIGGGCGGCDSRRPEGPLWILAALGIALGRRRRQRMQQ